ncbi:MAG: hypothetical protein AAF518_17260 [Spirochaetota bacterium]
MKQFVSAFIIVFVFISHVWADSSEMAELRGLEKKLKSLYGKMQQKASEMDRLLQEFRQVRRSYWKARADAAKIPDDGTGRLRFHVLDLMEGKVDVSDDNRFIIKGVPLTTYYSYSFKLSKVRNRKPTVKDAKEFYFPILPQDYDGAKDSIKIFVRVSRVRFRAMTKQMKKLIDFKDGERLITARKSDLKIPKVVVNVYRDRDIEVVPDNQILTIDLEDIQKP